MQDSFLVLPCHSIRPVSILPLFYFALRFAPLTVRRFRSLNLLFLLLVFVIATQSHSSRRSLSVFALLTRYFHYLPSSLLANLMPPALSFSFLLAV